MRRASYVLMLAACWVLPLASGFGGGAKAQAAGSGVGAWLPIPYPRPPEMTSDPSFAYTDAELGALMDKAKGAGAEGVVIQADWWILEPSPDAYRWSYTDRFVTFARRRGLKVGMQLTFAPPWVSPDGQRYPPSGSSDLAQWRDFAHDLAARYGTRVHRYEMWNEPNIAAFWPSGPNPAGYAALLRAGYLGAKAANPNVTVTGGSLSNNDMGYLNALYRQLRKYPDARANDDFFDELSVHPYSRHGSTWVAPDDPQDYTSESTFGPKNTNFWGYRKMRGILVSHNDSHKKIYIGEFGYNTKPLFRDPITDARRADWLKRGFSVANKNSSYVSGLNWHSYYTDVDRGFNIVNPTTLSESATFRALRAVNT